MGRKSYGYILLHSISLKIFSQAQENLYLPYMSSALAPLHHSMVQYKGIRAGEMGQCLRSLTALPEDLG